MKREQIKTFILLILLTNCLYLTGQICYDAKLWSIDYYFFYDIINNPIVANVLRPFGVIKNNNSSASSFEEVSKPFNFVFINGSDKEIIYENSKDYAELLSISDSLLKQAFESSTVKIDEITKKNWNEILFGKCIYVDYKVSFDSKYLLRSLGATSDNLSQTMPKIRSFAIYASGITNKIILSINTEEKFFSVYLDVNASDILKRVDEALVDLSKNYAFSYELGFDKDDEVTEVPKLITISPLVLLPLNENNLPVIDIEGTLNKENVLSYSDSIASAFGYTPSNLRKIVTGDGSVSFIENTGTVKVSPNSIVEFSTTSKGINLNNKNSKDNYESISNTLRIISNMLRDIPAEHYVKYRIISDVKSDEEVVEVKMDYYINGVPIIDSEFDSGIYFQISNGFLTKLRIRLINLHQTENMQEIDDTLKAVDDIYSKYNVNGGVLNIKELTPVYVINSSDGLPKWGVKLEGFGNKFLF